jgi:hypothetical protein
VALNMRMPARGRSNSRGPYVSLVSYAVSLVAIVLRMSSINSR